MKKTMKASIDARLSGLTMTQAKQQRILAMAEEETMGKKLSFTAMMAMALLAALITGACAAAIRFGMMDFRKDQQANETFLENVVKLDATYENEWLTLTVNDAVFDGSTLTVTMNLTGKANAPGQAYVLPSFSALCGGKAFPAGLMWSNVNLEEGLLLTDTDLQIGAEVKLWGKEAAEWIRDPANGPVKWMVSLNVLEAQWPVSTCEYSLNALHEVSAEELAAYDRQFQEAYLEKRILTNEAGWLIDYACQLPVPEDMTQDEWIKLDTNEKLVRCGAMKRVDTADIRFATRQQDMFALAEPQTFEWDGFVVKVNKLDVTFAAVEYELEIRAKEGNLCEDYLAGKGMYAFAVLADGAKTDYQSSGACITNGAHKVIVGGDSFALGESMLCEGSLFLDGTTRAITFVPCFTMSLGDCGEADAIMREQRILTDEQAARAFTIAW